MAWHRQCRINEPLAYFIFIFRFCGRYHIYFYSNLVFVRSVCVSVSVDNYELGQFSRNLPRMGRVTWMNFAFVLVPGRCVCMCACVGQRVRAGKRNASFDFLLKYIDLRTRTVCARSHFRLFKRINLSDRFHVNTTMCRQQCIDTVHCEK